jgi:hypothetical protein
MDQPTLASFSSMIIICVAMQTARVQQLAGEYEHMVVRMLVAVSDFIFLNVKL